LSWNIIFIINRLNWANWFTCSTIHTLIRLDIHHSIALIDAINWALFNTRFIHYIYTGKGDDVCHLKLLSEEKTKRYKHRIGISDAYIAGSNPTK
jgi:hypothetical protein